MPTTQGATTLTEEDDFAGVARELEAGRQQKPQPISWAFIAFMAFLTLVFIGLGVWQMQRLAWKEGLIARAEDRAHQAPVALPAKAEWGALDPEVYDFRPVTLTGHFIPGNTVLVFTALAAPRGKFGGPGYWVVAPFALKDGGAVMVNRGFVPESSKSLFARGSATLTPPPEGEITLTGLARTSAHANAFTPGPDLAAHIEYVRNIDRMKAMMDPGLGPFPQIYVDEDAGPPGVLPQGGETVVTFPNRHFDYAMTWFGMAGMVILMTGSWALKRRRKR